MSALPTQSAEELQTQIVAYLAKRLELDGQTLDVNEPFRNYGLDSARALGLMAELSTLLGRKLSPTLIWNYPNISSLAQHLAGAPKEPAHQEQAPVQPSEAEPIAIIGMACRFPGASSANEFWKLLFEGRDAITEAPSSRFDVPALYDSDPDAPGKMVTRWAGFLDQVEQFDPQFFSISPREALHMDPQQRLMLEVAWEVLEDAGIPPHTLKGSRTGVFCGVSWQEYAWFLSGDLEAITSHTGTGRSLAMISNRVSYALGLQGPSLSIDTACSSSLVSIQLACESLRRGESTLAIAGGVSVIAAPTSMVAISKFGALSPDGRCKAFDARADGFGRGEGAGAVLLKPLSRALADGDRIYSLILGGAINNDGESNGLTAPNPVAQERVLRDAYARAGRDGRQVDYVEAHGTGTPLGDPIEAKALGTVLSAGRPPEDPLWIGTVKTNIGHLEGAAGVAGLIKLALSLHHRALPASLQFQTPNPHIPFEELSLAVTRERRAWPHPERPALGGVSSFGWGGTNCHLVLEEYPQGQERLMLLSAESEEALRERAREAAVKVRSLEVEAPLQELCAAQASAARSEDPYRLALLVKSRQELETRLEQLVQSPAPIPRGDTGRRKIVFVFAPHGVHWQKMAWQLLQTEPVFRAKIEELDRAMRPYLDWSLLHQLSMGASNPRSEADAFTLPSIVAVQTALAALLRSWGIQPDLIVGHSLGEIAAAHAAGALDLDDMARVAAAYGLILPKTINRTGMAFANVSPEQAQEAVAPYSGRVYLAGFNSPKVTMFAGEAEALDALLAQFARDGIEGARIRTELAAHCALTDPCLEEFRAFLKELQPRETTTPLVVTLTGTVVSGREVGAEHWCRSVNQPVQFTKAMELASREDGTLFLEISPHPAISYAMRDNLKLLQRYGTVLPTMRRDSVRETLLGSLGTLFTLGVPAAWGSLQGPARGMERPLHVLTLSGRSAEALQGQAAQLARHLTSHPEQPLGDICYTAATGRTHHRHRLAVLASSREQVQRELQAFAAGELPPGCIQGAPAGSSRPKVAFLFTGQGSQSVGMGRALFETQPVFRNALLRCNELLRPLLSQPLLSILYPAEGESSSIGETASTQPALFALEYALAQLWRSWGVEPDMVMGHSLGEYVAACVAGVLSLEDGLKLVAARGRLMQALPRGGEMASVRADAVRVSAAIAPYPSLLSIGAFNAPDSVVISGAGEALRKVCAALEKEGVEVKFLQVSHAFHSPLMEPMLEQFEQVLGQVTFSSPRIRLVSNLTGQVAGAEIQTTGYWRRHIREPVHFARGMAALLEQGCRTFVELGPHPALLGLGAANAPKDTPCSWLPSLRRGQDDWRVILESLGRLHTLGVPVDWKGFDLAYPRRRVSLPAYAWQRQGYWLEEESVRGGRSRGRRRLGAGAHPLLGEPFQAHVTPGTRLWEAVLGDKELAPLAGCQVRGTAVVPASAWVEMALAAAQQSIGPGGYELLGLSVGEPLPLEPQQAYTLQTGLTREPQGWHSFQVCSAQQQETGPARHWKVHARGQLRLLEPREAESRVEQELLEALQRRCGEPVEVKELYQALSQQGLEYGAGLKPLAQVWRGAGEALGRLSALPASATALWVPGLLEAGVQLLLAALPQLPAAGVTRARQIRVYAKAEAEVWGHAKVNEQALSRGRTWEGDVVLREPSGRVVAEVLGLQLQGLAPAASSTGEDPYLALEWQPAPALATPVSGEAAGRWLLLSDTRGVGDAVQALLQAQGGSVIRAVMSPPPQPPGADVLTVDPTSPEAMARLLHEASRDGTPLRGVVHLWSLDAEDPQGSLPALETALARGLGSALNLVQALVKAEGSSTLFLAQSLARAAGRSPPRLWLVTRGAHAVGAPQPLVNVSQAPLLGLGRTLAFEHPDFRCSRVDLPSQDPVRQAEALVRELLVESASAEAEVALRPEGRYTARVARRAPDVSETEVWIAAEDRPVRLEPDPSGSLEHLALRPMRRRVPGKGEVEVQVEAAGVGFLDVLKARGMAPDGHEAGALGLECSGRVVALGEGVQGLHAGQEVVVALAPFSQASYVTVPAAHVWARPHALKPEQAAAIPLAFTTAWYAIHTLGRLRAAERILIHSAASGVGLAAVQLAQRAGAEIFATAGTEEKRAYLRGLGLRHVMDSRSSSFVREVMEATGGAGVDVVLNSLPGEAIEHGLSVLAEDGRFIELGQQAPDAAHSPLRLDAFRKGLSYSRVDLRGYAARRPDRLHALLQEVMGAFEAGQLQPLPVQVFPLSRAEEALRLTAEGRHLGRAVLKLGDPRARMAVSASEIPPVRADGRYLIAGSLGELGLPAARWLVEQGARHLVLVDGTAAPPHEPSLAALRATGARVEFLQVDLSNAEQLASALLGDGTQPSLRGIIHTASPQEEAMLQQLVWERVWAVMARRVRATWNLHTLACTLPLDFFVLFSSASSLLGYPGQGTTAINDAFLDALAHHRRALGLPALTINWGFLGSTATQAQSQKQEGSSLTPREAAAMMGRLLRGNTAQVGIVPRSVQRWIEFYPQAAASPFLSGLLARAAPSESSTGSTPPLQIHLSAADPSERPALLQEFIREQLAQVLRMSAESIDLHTPVSLFGLDSLMAIELRNRVQAGLALSSLQITTFRQGATLTELTPQLLQLWTSEQLVSSLRDDGAAASNASGDWEVLTL